MDDNNSPQKSRKVGSEDESELMEYPYMVNDEILSSPDISFHIDDNIKAPIESQHLPTVLEDVSNIPLTCSAPTSTQPLPTTVQDVEKAHPLNPPIASE